MSGTKTVRRSADITPKEAFEGLLAKYPKYRIASFDVVSNGKVYEAKLVSAEFPPPAKDDSEDTPEASPPADDGDGDDDSGESDGPPAPKKKEEKGGESHALAELTHLVKMIAEAVGVPVGHSLEGGPPDETAPGGDPGMEGGPMAPPAPAPLPPPAKPGGMGGGLGSPFSKVASEQRSFVVWREPDEDGTLPDIKTAAAEVRAQLPKTHKLAQITLKRAKIDNGEPVNVWLCAITSK